LGELKAVHEVPKPLREVITACQQEPPPLHLKEVKLGSPIQLLFWSTPGLGGVFVSDVVTQPLKHEPRLVTALKNNK
jgi:hypothetical protein